MAKSKESGFSSGSTPQKATQSGHEDGLQVGPVVYRSDDEVKQIAEYLGVDEDKAYADYKAVTDFTGHHYSDIRESARNGGTDERWKQCEDFIANAPQWNGGETRRGISLSADEYSNIKVGAVFDVNGGGPASWSTSAGIADSFAGNRAGHSVVFIAKKHGSATSVKGISRHNDEDEVLASMNNKYKVTSVSKGNGPSNNRLYVEVEAV
ncbi:hypothetical protein [Ellagibacter isourolithinifaciens]|uniref:hypothetical protein n=1 Tax=Ellagibacter isourolithinifaciens TaxID=2137581 RepID=UPI003AAA92E3